MLEQIIDFLKQNAWAGNLAMTLGLLAAVLLLRWLLARSVRRAQIRSIDLRRRWLVQIRNLAFTVFVLGAIIIWASELRTAALSIVAILVALVIATKELILCLSGSLLKTSSGAFAIGDRVEVGGIRGEVIDQTLLATRIMEIGPTNSTHQLTGRTVTIPNAAFLTSPVFNENIVDDFVFDVMCFPLKSTEPCLQLAEQLAELALEVSGDYLEEARTRIGRLGEKKGLDTPTIDPRVSLEFPDPDKVHLLLRVAMPADRKGLIQRELRYRFLEARQALAAKSPGTEDASATPASSS